MCKHHVQRTPNVRTKWEGAQTILSCTHATYKPRLHTWRHTYYTHMHVYLLIVLVDAALDALIMLLPREDAPRKGVCMPRMCGVDCARDVRGIGGVYLCVGYMARVSAAKTYTYNRHENRVYAPRHTHKHNKLCHCATSNARVCWHMRDDRDAKTVASRFPKLTHILRVHHRVWIALRVNHPSPS